MVQSPASIIAQLGVPLSWLICGFTMWDLEFSIGAMIFYGVLSVGTLSALAMRRSKLEHGHVTEVLFVRPKQLPDDCVEHPDKRTPTTCTEVLFVRPKQLPDEGRLTETERVNPAALS